jgi:hypothetical protein
MSEQGEKLAELLDRGYRRDPHGPFGRVVADARRDMADMLGPVRSSMHYDPPTLEEYATRRSLRSLADILRELSRIREMITNEISNGGGYAECAGHIQRAITLEWVLGDFRELDGSRGSSFQMARRLLAERSEEKLKAISQAAILNEHVSRYPAAEELEEEAEPVVHPVEEMRLADDGCPHDAPDAQVPDPGFDPNYDHFAQFRADGLQGDDFGRQWDRRQPSAPPICAKLDLITKDASNKLAFFLRDTNLKYELRLTVDGEQDGQRVLIGASFGDLAAHRAAQPTYRPDGSIATPGSIVPMGGWR